MHSKTIVEKVILEASGNRIANKGWAVTREHEIAKIRGKLTNDPARWLGELHFEDAEIGEDGSVDLHMQTGTWNHLNDPKAGPHPRSALAAATVLYDILECESTGEGWREMRLFDEIYLGVSKANDGRNYLVVTFRCDTFDRLVELTKLTSIADWAGDKYHMTMVDKFREEQDYAVWEEQDYAVWKPLLEGIWNMPSDERDDWKFLVIETLCPNAMSERYVEENPDLF